MFDHIEIRVFNLSTEIKNPPYFSMSLNIKILSEAADQARGLCMDAVQASQSGHLGLPLGCAEMGAVLYGYALKYNPDKPRWINCDIFVLSGGHAACSYTLGCT